MLVVVVSLALWPGRALAAYTPDRNPIPSGDLISPAACSDPISFHVLENNEYTIDFFDADGNLVRTIIQGRVVLEITNLTTQASVIRNVSGPGTITYADLLFVGRGSQLFFFEPNELGPGKPGEMFINHGKVVEFLGVDPDIPPRIISKIGVQEDLCATLGASPDAEALGAEASESPGSEASGTETSEEQVQPQSPLDAPVEGLKPPVF